ncbi:hypothetical protein RhiirB3_443752 [Rhizophagus irregularis]|nr:hypothetical protein RhiirB3_443752 [Rhizophagus irregularis]
MPSKLSLRANGSGKFFFVLLLRNRRVFPSDFIRSGFLRIFIRLGEDDEWMMDGGWCI